MRLQRNQKENGEIGTEMVFSSVKEKLLFQMQFDLEYFRINREEVPVHFESVFEKDFGWLSFKLYPNIIKTKVFLHQDNLKFKFLTEVDGLKIYSDAIHSVYEVQLKYSKVCFNQN